MGTRQEVLLHQRNMAKDETGMTEICAMSSTTEMHVVGLKTGIRSASAMNMSSVKKGTMTTMVSITTNLTDSVLLKGGTLQEESKPFSHDLKRVCWPLNFKPSGIKKYDGSTNPIEWLEVYQLTINVAGGLIAAEFRLNLSSIAF
jgi:hypothetical protein